MSSKPAALAVVTGSELVWLDAKQATTAPLSRTTLATPTAFAADGPTVYVASAHGVAKYGRDSGVHLFSHGQEDEASALCIGDSGTVFVARSNSICVYDPGSLEPSQTLEGHSSPITSLALSNDGVLLASTSKTVHVHDLSNASRTILRGLPCPNAVASCATFHPSRPNTLFVAISRQLVIYDTTKPAGPAKVVQIGGSSCGDIVAIDCSPFSKSLLAVACSGGIVGIVDLDKEKSLVKTIDTKSRLTSLRFQPDAAVIVVGTTDGRLQYHDLRSTDKQPHVVAVDKRGGAVLGLAWPKVGKHVSKPSVASTIKAPITSSKSAVLQERRSPAQAAGLSKGKSSSPTTSTTLNGTTKSMFSPAKAAGAHRPAFAASKSAPDVALRVARAAKENAPTARPSPSLRISPPKPSSKPESAAGKVSLQSRLVARPVDRKPRTSSSSQASTRILTSRRISSTTTSSRTSGLPSPSFPSESELSSSPSRNADSKRRDVQALGLGTPGPRRQPARHRPSTSPPHSIVEAGAAYDEEDNNTIIQFAKTLAREPDRVPSSASTAESISTDNVAAAATANLQLSPARRPQPFVDVDMSPVRSALNNSPQASLRAFMQELATKDDIKGLHMDLIRMGMAWKSEMRSLMDQHLGDLSNLRQENAQLREELQRLRNRY